MKTEKIQLQFINPSQQKLIQVAKAILLFLIIISTKSLQAAYYSGVDLDGDSLEDYIGDDGVFYSNFDDWMLNHATTAYQDLNGNWWDTFNVFCAANPESEITNNIPTSNNISTINDGIPDSWKIIYNFDIYDLSLSQQDPDGDGLTNLQEFINGTDPLHFNSSPSQQGAVDDNQEPIAPEMFFGWHGLQSEQPTWFPGDILWETADTIVGGYNGLSDDLWNNIFRPDSGYYNIGLTGGSFLGASGGLYVAQDGVYPYLGYGFTTPGITGSLTASEGSPSPGLSAETASLDFFLGVSNSLDSNGNYSEEYGVFTAPGASWMATYTWP